MLAHNTLSSLGPKALPTTAPSSDLEAPPGFLIPPSLLLTPLTRSCPQRS